MSYSYNERIKVMSSSPSLSKMGITIGLFLRFAWLIVILMTHFEFKSFYRLCNLRGKEHPLSAKKKVVSATSLFN